MEHVVNCDVSSFTSISDGSRNFKLHDVIKDLHEGDLITLNEISRCVCGCIGTMGFHYTGNRIKAKASKIKSEISEFNEHIISLDLSDVDVEFELPCEVN